MEDDEGRDSIFFFSFQNKIHSILILSTGVKTGSSRLGPDEGGKCDSVGLSAACPSKVATIHSVVVAVT